MSVIIPRLEEHLQPPLAEGLSSPSPTARPGSWATRRHWTRAWSPGLTSQLCLFPGVGSDHAASLSLCFLIGNMENNVARPSGLA